MALKAADVGRLGLDEMGISFVLFLLVQSRILLELGYLITCKRWLMWITLVIDGVPCHGCSVRPLLMVLLR